MGSHHNLKPRSQTNGFNVVDVLIPEKEDMPLNASVTWCPDSMRAPITGNSKYLSQSGVDLLRNLLRTYLGIYLGFT
jgi:hypothetical protein